MTSTFFIRFATSITSLVVMLAVIAPMASAEVICGGSGC
jgi:hypothetical protein